MTIRHDPFIDVDFVMSQGETELVVSIRTNDGSKLDQQDAMDGFLAALEEAYGIVAQPISRYDAENDPDLH